MRYFGSFLLACLLFAACADQSEESMVCDSVRVVESDSLESDPAQEKQAYLYAIANYIDSIYKHPLEPPDTLFIGKHDQFPNIQLPYTIQNIPVVLLTNDEYKVKTEQRVHSVFINMIGTQTVNGWEFTMITLFDYAIPQHNCYVNFNYDSRVKEFTLDTLYFLYPYERK